MDTRTVKALAREHGFVLCGVAPAEPTTRKEHVVDWLNAGRHGSMAWLAKHVEERLDPGKLLPGARSVICVADHIGARPGTEPSPQSSPKGRGGKIARYAQVDDYHKVIKKRLHALADALRERSPEAGFRVCVDTAPVLEREFHHRAGLGWVGKNTMLIHPSRGSHLLLGEIVTTLELEADSPEPDHCGTCTRCIDACPTHCITPYAIDASRCVSYLTIEHRDEIDPALHEAMGDWLYGCDVCQDVCPYNDPDRGRVGEVPLQVYGTERGATMDALDVLNWTEDDRRGAFTRSPMKRAKLDQMKRNALIVLGNAAHLDDTVLGRIQEVADDAGESAIVRDTARQILARRSPQGLQARHRQGQCPRV